MRNEEKTEQFPSSDPVGPNFTCADKISRDGHKYGFIFEDLGVHKGFRIILYQRTRKQLKFEE